MRNIWVSILSWDETRWCFLLRSKKEYGQGLVRRAVLSADTNVWVEELPSDLKDVFQLNLF